MACRILVPGPGIEPVHLPTGPPGKFPQMVLAFFFFRSGMRGTQPAQHRASFIQRRFKLDVLQGAWGQVRQDNACSPEW